MIRCGFKTSLILHCWSAYCASPAKSYRKKIYQKVSGHLESFSPNCGPLVIGHSIGILSEVGLLPPWFREFAVVDKGSKYMAYFIKTYATGQTMRGSDCDRLVSTLVHRFSELRGEKVTMSVVENIMCKSYRVLNKSGSDTKWADTLYPGQTLFCRRVKPVKYQS